MGNPPPGAVLTTPKMHHRGWDAQPRRKRAVCVSLCKDACIAPKRAGGVGALLHPGRCNALQKCTHHPPNCIGGGNASCTQVDATLCKMHASPSESCMRGGSAPAAGSMQPFAKMHALPQNLHRRREHSCSRVDPALCEDACITPKIAWWVGALPWPGRRNALQRGAHRPKNGRGGGFCIPPPAPLDAPVQPTPPSVAKLHHGGWCTCTAPHRWF